ncbi:hypothetical protein PCANC_20490 [Puccinia coronata f. sp. avenae]|uniref:Uncharacterized protein n=1 Tax=Puccinia coronata f. sp. avenae TaxID=200324 RepID=A0A2N5U995_9BASI|nr:hypothetical protein PCANC_20490 [Puccinia coronata f. sp. avenae]PLW34311.1 hypothetical protein PCASD_17268 [Puccinia coronata f. sp. avenae]
MGGGAQRRTWLLADFLRAAVPLFWVFLHCSPRTSWPQRSPSAQPHPSSPAASHLRSRLPPPQSAGQTSSLCDVFLTTGERPSDLTNVNRKWNSWLSYIAGVLTAPDAFAIPLKSP